MQQFLGVNFYVVVYLEKSMSIEFSSDSTTYCKKIMEKFNTEHNCDGRDDNYINMSHTR